jgi:hypothetical protein
MKQDKIAYWFFPMILIISVFLRPAVLESYQSNPLIGRWIWIEDEDGTNPVKGAQCSLIFFPDGYLILSCFKPGETAEGTGSYSVHPVSVNGGIISIHIPDYGKKVIKQGYQLKKDIMTLPFPLVGKGNWSHWKRETGTPEPSMTLPAIAYRAYETALIRGDSDDDAAQVALSAVREKLKAVNINTGGNIQYGSFQSFYGGTSNSFNPLVSSPPSAFEQARLNASKTSIKIHREGGREYYILLKSKMPSTEDFRHRTPAIPITPATFVNDPRTHFYMQKSRGPDDPSNHSALLLFPMHTQKTFSRGRYFSFKGVKEKPEYLEQQLQRAGYADSDIIIKCDADVTPALIRNKLKLNPGVFYISSHGDIIQDLSGNPQFMVLTGMRLIARPKETLQGAMQRIIKSQNLPLSYNRGIVAVTLQVDRWQEAYFIGLTEDFFRELQKECDLSSSFVFVDACNSAKRNNLSRLLNAGGFLGWQETVDPKVSVRYAKYIFTTLVRKSYSLRETWYRLGRTLKTRRSIHQEDKLLDDSDAILRTGLVESYLLLTALGSDQKPYPILGKLYRESTENGVFWLLWLGRWNQNPARASQNLKSCYDKVWSNARRGLGISLLCRAGYRGTYIPKKNEVREARQLLNGTQRPIPGGRWTLADQLDYRKEF